MRFARMRNTKIQRWPVLTIAGVVVVATGFAISRPSHQDENSTQPPVALHRLGIGDRVILHEQLFASRDPAWEALESGNQLWKNGKHASAMSMWTLVAQIHVGTEAALAAQSSLAQAARNRGDILGAISAYNSLIAHPDPPISRGGFGMIVRSDYKHRACIELSDLYVESGDLYRALDSGNLALNVHIDSGTCGVSFFSLYLAIEERAGLLRQAIAEDREMRLE